MKNPYNLTDETFTVFTANGDSHSTHRSNPNWQKIKDVINGTSTELFLSAADEEAYLIQLMKPITAIEAALEDTKDLNVRYGAVFYGDEKIHSALSKRLLDVMSENIDITPWKLFVKNLFANPQGWAQGELYDFLEGSDLPITSDGCFLAYKIVGPTYRDLHSGRFDNSVGKVVEIPRQDVDVDRYRTCSTGLHFCSKGYLGSYGTTAGNRVVMVKINPADVVSIPVDYNFSKGRTWKYEVVAEIEREAAATQSWSAVYDYDDYGNDEDDWDEYDDGDVCGCGDPDCNYPF